MKLKLYDFEKDVEKLFSKQDQKIDELSSKYGLKNPNKEFHSWWQLENRMQSPVLKAEGYGEAIGVKQERAKRAHKKRRKKARIADESFNAPITTDYWKWRKNMSKYDFYGVDTIPLQYRVKRIERYRKVAKKKKIYSKLHKTNRSINTLGARGRYNILTKEITLAKETRYPKHSRTFAHELGHAIDFKVEGNDLEMGGFSKAVVRTNNIDAIVEHANVMRDTREKAPRGWSRRPAERTAQFIANYMIQPRATKRDYPNLSKMFKEMELDRLRRFR